MLFSSGCGCLQPLKLARLRGQGYISSDPAALPFDGLRLRSPISLSSSDLGNILQQIDFSRLYHGYLCNSYEKWAHYVYFLRWLRKLSVSYSMPSPWPI